MTAPSEVLVKRIIERFRGPTGRTEPDLRRDPRVVVRVADTDVGPGSVPEGRLKVYAEEVLEGGKRLMKEVILHGFLLIPILIKNCRFAESLNEIQGVIPLKSINF